MAKYSGSKERRQIIAIKASAKKGKEIAHNCPQIVDDYRAGSTLAGIVENYDLLNKYDLHSENVASNAVRCALEILLTREELERIAKEHRIEGGSKGGKISGPRSYKKGIGLYTITEKERRQSQRKAAVTRGQMPWSDEEERYFLNLCSNPDYWWSKGRPDYKKVGEELAKNFGIKRTVKALTVFACKQKKEELKQAK